LVHALAIAHGARTEQGVTYENALGHKVPDHNAALLPAAKKID